MLTKEQHKRNASKSSRASRGFTLMELLVGMTIFLVIMLSVTLMFNAVVRTSKIGYQNQTAYQVVRGVFDTIEQDVSRAYTSRETGLKDTFYGTPYGFTFIGMVDTDGDGEFNLSRITYVIYSTNDNTTDPLRIVHQSTADEYADSADRVTYSLLRYIEPGVDNLDSFPIDWTANIVDDIGNPTTMQAVIDVIVADNAATLCDGSLDCNESLDRALKSEFWIRMLAGDTRIVNIPFTPRFVTLPRFWGPPTAQRSGFYLNNSARLLAGEVMDPADYVLAENILHISRLTDLDIVGKAFPDRTIAPTQYDSTDTDTYDALTSADLPLIDNGTFFADRALLDLAEKLVPSVPPTDNENFVTFNPNTDMPLDYFFTYRDGVESIDTQTKLDLDGNVVIDPVTLNPIPYTTLTSRDFAYWNDTRNQEFNFGVNDTVTTANAASGTPVPVVDIISTTPDLNDTALPESMQLQFTLFYPSPFPGAPDFEKTFTQQINLPTAFRRKQDSINTILLREID